MRTCYVCVLGLVLFAAPVLAQGPTSYQASYYNAGAPAPIQTETFAATAAVCNQAPPAVTTTVNPTRVVFDDIANAGKVCILTEPAGGTLLSFPVGSYEGTLAAVNTAGASAESARAPFSRVALLSAPTNVKLVR